MSYWNNVCTGALLLVLFFQLSTIQSTSITFATFELGVFTQTSKQNELFGKETTIPLQALTAAAKTNEVYDEITFVGDVLLARNVEFLMDSFGEAYPFSGYSFEDQSSNPAVVINFESTIPQSHVRTPSFQLNFSTPKKFAETLTKTGVTHASLANNHSYDFGKDAYSHTQTSLAEQEIEAFGNPNTVNEDSVTYIKLHDTKVALIGIAATGGKPAGDIVRSLFKEATARSDVQFVYIHWGDEYVNSSNEFQRTYAAELVAFGADAIIGHHPHVVQEIALVDGVPVFYSLGNYIFDQYANANVQTGLVLRFSDEHRLGFYLQPVTSVDSKSQPRPLDKYAHAAFLYDLANQSDQFLRESITTGFIPLKTVATSSKIAIIY